MLSQAAYALRGFITTRPSRDILPDLEKVLKAALKATSRASTVVIRVLKLMAFCFVADNGKGDQLIDTYVQGQKHPQLVWYVHVFMLHRVFKYVCTRPELTIDTNHTNQQPYYFARRRAKMAIAGTVVNARPDVVEASLALFVSFREWNPPTGRDLAEELVEMLRSTGSNTRRNVRGKMSRAQLKKAAQNAQRAKGAKILAPFLELSIADECADDGGGGDCGGGGGGDGSTE